MCMFMVVVVVCMSIIWKTTNKGKRNLTKQILCKLARVPHSSPGFKSSLVNTAPRATRGAPKPD